MATQAQVELARIREAPVLADMSRRLVEHGLGWRWTPAALRRCMRAPETEVVVIRAKTSHPVAFGVMRYDADEAHLILLAVSPGARRRGLATVLMGYLESMARTAGICSIQLEVRATNTGARAFYAARGYAVTARLRGYYQGREDALRMCADLRLG